MFFSLNNLGLMLKMQAQANAMMGSSGKHWLVSDYPWYRAVYMEAAEGIGHHGFKWWKKENPNIEQIKLELIDILHFSLSEVLVNAFNAYNPNKDNESVEAFGNRLVELEYVDPIVSIASRVYTADAPTEGTETLLDTLESLIAYCAVNKEIHNGYLIALFNHLNMSEKEVTQLYVGKNVLNKFRTKNGQKENKYTKIWFGREDNEHLSDFMASREKLDIDEINAYLEDLYVQVTLPVA